MNEICALLNLCEEIETVKPYVGNNNIINLF